MARLARVVVPGMPHHLTQRGNRRQPTFFCEEDYAVYLQLMGQWCKERGVEVWAYCLMPNHVHLIATPNSEDGLRRAIGEAHRRYTRRVNFRQQWRGHLWQGRFASFVLDEPYLLAAARYVELNPVRTAYAMHQAIIVGAGAVAPGREGRLPGAGFAVIEDCGELARLAPRAVSDEQLKEFREHERTGRALGDDDFQKRLEKNLGRVLRRQKPGPKRTLIK